MDCTPIPKEKLYSYNALSKNDLARKISQCICQQMYGIGSTDVTGVGVPVSFGMQFAIAIFFWAVLFFMDTAIPAFRTRHTPAAVISWVSQHHETCLWSQLIFTLAFCLAGVARQGQRRTQFIGVFESSSLIGSVPISFISLLLTTVSIYKRIRRWKLFTLGFAATMTLAVLAELFPLWAARAENILEACITFANENDLPWKTGLVKPYRSGVAQIFVSTGLVAVLLSFWYLLLLLKCLNATFSYFGRSLGNFGERILVIFVGLLSVFMAYNVVDCFRDILAERQSMDLIWGGQTGQNIWGIGQIAALFLWVPLLTDMAYSAVHGRRPQAESRGDRPSDVEAGLGWELGSRAAN